MSRYFGLIVALLAIQNDLFAAEAGMPQLDQSIGLHKRFG